jgi:hypothetical protein
VRASAPCIVRSEAGVVLQGSADLQSGPRGWRATVYAGPRDEIELLGEGRYEIELPSGTHEVRLAGVRVASREVRFLDRGPAPAEIARRRRSPILAARQLV